TGFILVEDFNLNTDYSFGQLLNAAKSQNLGLIEARKSLEISERNIDISKGTYYPSLSVSTGYSYSNNQSDASFLSENRSNGLNGGINLSYNLFNGGRSAIARENAKIVWENSKLRIDDLNTSLETEIEIAYTSYVNNLNVVSLRESALKVSEQNFSRTQELIKNAQVNGTDFREAQLNLLNAEIMLYLSRVSAKISEYELLRLSGQLVSVN
ncbi:MAG: TolC family protein, partial [Bacteroidia bacterium]